MWPSLRYVLAGACIALLGCTQPSSAPVREQSYRYFERADVHSLVEHDPVSLAREDLKEGRERFLGVAGFAIQVPGAEREKCALLPNRVFIVGGTTDAGPMNEQLRAREFALRYNTVIREHLVRKGTYASFFECRE